ncbi:DNA sulfur modification protein DndD [Agrobacterium tumefaciens]|uniref:DNA sulfur modification protein DndD n=1 Tax=Agrobacterium tumefaciens TaxID=358 RepID=UPI0015746E59|nr:DNA sulfur modification protein DndD [Agrobacterium tumefaciens]NSX84329.1 DNA sulfur modification protein DndD [Agrobacterium tumefaciens]
MFISQITLRDWKAYTTANFEFPAPAAGKNIVLIGAPNGYGKTSLFEAIVLGMFGRDGLPLIARSPFSGGDRERLATSYSSFLEKALHRGAVAAGRYSCSVKLSFVDDDGETLEIQRIWHYNDRGEYRAQDEEIQIFRGSTRKAVGPGALQGNERSDWYREYIAENLLPFTLAHFFMFDGEQVSVLAEREMSAQVRAGIEGLLGIPVLKTLAKDLRAYAEVRRKDSPNVSDKTIERLELERHQLTFEYDKKVARYEVIDPSLAELKEEREHLTRELATFGAGSQALLQEQFEQIKTYERAIEQANAQLEDLMMKDIALALSGRGLREKLKARLASETVLERWESGKSQGDSNLERFIEAVGVGVSDIKPPLSELQHRSVLDSARNAWEKLWYPRPADCADEFLHRYLNELERSKVVDQLDQLDELGATIITEVLSWKASSEEALQRLQEEVTRTEAISPHVDKKRERLSQLNGEIQQHDQEYGALKREMNVLESQINQKNTELTKLAGQWDQAKPSVRRAMRALKVAAMVDDIVAKAVPSQIDAIATAMTKAHRAMAHKKDLVDRIAIDEDCDVKLLNDKGMDLRGYDLSAGEKQIFTQALISAVSSVSGRGFPMVVDTPLGRLDIEHRKGVLNHLVQREHQVILLSTNTEVVGDYLREIEPHVQRKYLVQFERVGDIGQSSVRPGYFDDAGGRT